MSEIIRKNKNSVNQQQMNNKHYSTLNNKKLSIDSNHNEMKLEFINPELLKSESEHDDEIDTNSLGNNFGNKNDNY